MRKARPPWQNHPASEHATVSTLQRRLAAIEQALNPDPDVVVEWRVLFHDEPAPPDSGPILQLRWADELENGDSSDATPQGLPE